MRVRLSAAEERDLVPAVERGLGDVAAEEERASEDEQPHAAKLATEALDNVQQAGDATGPMASRILSRATP